MNLFMKCIVLLLVGSLISLYVGAQDIAEEISKINGFFKEKRNYEMSLSYGIFEDYDQVAPTRLQESSVKKKGTNLYTKYGEKEVYEVDDKVISIDHALKEVIFVKRYNKHQNISLDGFTHFLDSLLINCQEKRIEKVKGNTNKLVLGAHMSQYQQIEFYYNSKTYKMDKLVLYYRTNPYAQGSKPKMEIICTEFKDGDNIPDAFFSITNILSRKADKYVLQTSYKEYRLKNYYDEEER